MPDQSSFFLRTGPHDLEFLVRSERYQLTSRADSWFAELWFERPDSTIRVTYGDRESIGNVIVSRTRDQGRTPDFALWEWLQGLGAGGADATCASLILSEAAMQAFLASVADALRQHLSSIVSASAAFAADLEAARHRRLANDRTASGERELERLSAQASTAFWSHDYERVVSLLTPLEPRLGPADREKLEHARRRLRGVV